MGIRRATLVLAILVAAGCGLNAAEPAASTRPDPLVVRVRGEQYQWHVQHPGRDGRLDTADDIRGRRDLHLPDATNVRIELESGDYLYGFRVPELAVNQVAVPDLAFSAELRADAAGRYPLQGDQMCGFQHESLLGQVVVHDAAGYDGWLAAHD